MQSPVSAVPDLPGGDVTVATVVRLSPRPCDLETLAWAAAADLPPLALVDRLELTVLVRIASYPGTPPSLLGYLAGCRHPSPEPPLTDSEGDLWAAVLQESFAWLRTEVAANPSTPPGVRDALAGDDDFCVRVSARAARECRTGATAPAEPAPAAVG